MKSLRFLLVPLLATFPPLAWANSPTPQPVELTKTAPSKVIPFDASDSARRLARAQHKAAFFALASHFESQINKVFCGPASATIVLNTLRTSSSPEKKPQDPAGLDTASLPKGFDPRFEKYTQNTFFNEKTDAVKTKAQVLGKTDSTQAKPDFGLTLEQLAGMLRAHGLAVQVHHADASVSDKDLVRDIFATLDSTHRFVLVNFARAPLGQMGGGHISPVAAYDAKSDSFLVLDVNPNTSPWFWVSRADLIKAMRTLDGSSYRGYVIVSEQN